MITLTPYNRYIDASIEQADSISALVLAANVAQTVEIPDGASFVLFSAKTNFYSKFSASGSAAEVPSVSVTDGTACELNPTGRYKGAHAYVSIISDEANVVTLAFYK